jgi:hypothetical protein
MAKPKMSTKTPDNTDTNALIEGHGLMIEHFNSREHNNRHIALVEFGVTNVVTFEGGEQQANIVVRHVELLTGPNEVAGEKLFTKVYRERTNNSTRPAPEDAATPDTPLEGLGGDVDDSLEG